MSLRWIVSALVGVFAGDFLALVSSGIVGSFLSDVGAFPTSPAQPPSRLDCSLVAAPITEEDQAVCIGRDHLEQNRQYLDAAAGTIPTDVHYSADRFGGIWRVHAGFVGWRDFGFHLSVDAEDGEVLECEVVRIRTGTPC